MFSTTIVLLIARANRDDASVKDGIINIIQEPKKNYILRMHALSGMEKIGTEDDMPLLQALANTDSFQEKRMRGPNQVEAIYPVREAAKSVIQKIQEKEALK